MQVLPLPQYLQEFTKKIPLARHRIVLVAMTITWGEKTGLILRLIEDALSRGVEVCILCDGYYSRLPIAYDEFWPGRQTRSRRPLTTEFLRNLADKGAKIIFSRTKGGSPYKGAFHAKLTVVDDDVYSFGGVNFRDEDFDHIDYMLHAKNIALANMLCSLVKSYASKMADMSWEYSAHETILFDSGKSGESIIYDHACALSQEATKIWYVSQMCPSGKLAVLLRSTDSYCYFNRPNQSIGPNGAAIAVDQVRYKIKNLYKGRRYLHAKFILFEYADGKKRLLSGSHNFSWRGVRYGTAEIALESENTSLWQDLYAFMQQEVILV